jgi:hypothetical protein
MLAVIFIPNFGMGRMAQHSNAVHELRNCHIEASGEDFQ